MTQWGLRCLCAEAGKSSLLRALLGRNEEGQGYLTRKDERTIGLDIERLVLPDARAPEAGVTLLTYDAGERISMSLNYAFRSESRRWSSVSNPSEFWSELE